MTAATPKRGGANPIGNETGRSSTSWRMCSLDSGAGPRKLWEAVVGPRFIDAGWKIDAKVRRLLLVLHSVSVVANVNLCLEAHVSSRVL